MHSGIMKEYLFFLFGLFICLVNAINLGNVDCKHEIYLDQHVNRIDNSYNPVEGSWNPMNSDCQLKFYSNNIARTIYITISYSKMPKFCKNTDYKNWMCGFMTKDCSEIFYTINSSGNGIKIYPTNHETNRYHSDFLKLMYCGDQNFKIDFHVDAIKSYNSDNSYNSSVLIRVIIPTLSVGIFIILVSFFILFAIKWKIFNCNSHGHNHRLRHGQNYDSQRASRHRPVSPPPPPPPPYEEINKYPLSVRFQEQVRSALRHARDSFRNSFRSADTPPPNYDVAIASITKSSQVSLRDRASVNPSYQPDNISETIPTSGNVQPSPQIPTLSKPSRQVITCSALHSGQIYSPSHFRNQFSSLQRPTSLTTTASCADSIQLPRRSLMLAHGQTSVLPQNVVVSMEKDDLFTTTNA